MGKDRTDRIIAAIMEELERRRPQIEADGSLRTLTVIVAMNERSGRPHRVIYRTESQSERDYVS